MDQTDSPSYSCSYKRQTMVIQGAHLYLRVRLSTVSMLLSGELIRR